VLALARTKRLEYLAPEVLESYKGITCKLDPNLVECYRQAKRVRVFAPTIPLLIALMVCLKRLFWLVALAGKVQMFEDFISKPEKVRAITIARAFERNFQVSFNPTRAGAHDHDAVAHINGFVRVMSHEQQCRAADLPESQDLSLQFHSRKGGERAQRFVQE